MKKHIMLALTAAAFAVTAYAASDVIPDIIFVPESAKVTEAEKKWFDGFELEANLTGTTLIDLTQQVNVFYLDKGFEISREDIKDDDVELLFVKGQEQIEVDIELEHNNLIEYSVDYETK